MIMDPWKQLAVERGRSGSLDKRCHDLESALARATALIIPVADTNGCGALRQCVEILRDLVNFDMDDPSVDVKTENEKVFLWKRLRDAADSGLKIAELDKDYAETYAEEGSVPFDLWVRMQERLGR
jgi:hypothetical protein